MATAPSLVTFDEYMQTVYSPDCEYVDGMILERNVGKGKHSYTQMEIAVLLRAQAKPLGLQTLPEQRVQVAAYRVRVPDVCVVAELEEVIKKPPLLCIEVLSPDDRWSRVNQSVADYVAMGVGCVWIVDPYGRRAWIIDQELPPAEVTDGVLRASALKFELALAEVLPPSGGETAGEASESHK